jgi:hypothetical protein
MWTSKPDLKKLQVSSTDANHVGLPRPQTEQRGLAYFVTAGFILVNFGLLGLSVVLTLFSLMGFDAGSSPAAEAWFFACCGLVVVMSGIVLSSIALHQKGRFKAVAVVSAIPFPFVLAAVSLLFWVKW